MCLLVNMSVCIANKNNNNPKEVGKYERRRKKKAAGHCIAIDRERS